MMCCHGDCDDGDGVVLLVADNSCTVSAASRAHLATSSAVWCVEREREKEEREREERMEYGGNSYLFFPSYLLAIDLPQPLREPLHLMPSLPITTHTREKQVKQV